MKLFLDSAITDEIKHSLEYWDLDGLTTNPKHVKNSGKPFLKVIEEIAELFAGTEKPVSVEVDPHITDWEQIVEQGLLLSKMSPNFVIKVGASENGFKAIRELTKRGIRTNATLIFSVAQAWHAARAGASFISPFIGWKETYGDSTTTFILEVAEMLERHEYNSEIIAAAIRNGRQMADAALAGAHCVTAGLTVYQESMQNPYTVHGEKVFQNAWDETPKD
ncbi:putative transaldolase [Gimesia alba]|uniref:Putative transaldolase n=1 Tax=Gimesia alba TaxID=2527973 RepID=A0A517RPK3_9PLAN|nr:transaldolase family protein [Gimesia alba]QDT45809.1 putative transaldolase [Gimesia alba]